MREAIATHNGMVMVWITAPASRSTIAAGVPGTMTPGPRIKVITTARAANGSSASRKIANILKADPLVSANAFAALAPGASTAIAGNRMLSPSEIIRTTTSITTVSTMPAIAGTPIAFNGSYNENTTEMIAESPINQPKYTQRRAWLGS